MSAVGSQRLDILLYRIPGRFVDSNDQTVVAASRHLGHLYIYCDINRVKQMLSRMGALLFRIVPVIYVQFKQRASVSECAHTLAAPPVGREVLEQRHTTSLLLKSSDDWSCKPFAVGVHVVYDDGATHTRLLLGRPYTPARTK